MIRFVGLAGQWSSVEQINTFLSLCNSLSVFFLWWKPIERPFWRLGGTNDSFKTSPPTLWMAENWKAFDAKLESTLRSNRFERSISLSPIDRSLSGPNRARLNCQINFRSTSSGHYDQFWFSGLVKGRSERRSNLLAILRFKLTNLIAVHC